MKKALLGLVSVLSILLTSCSPSINTKDNVSLYNTWEVEESNVPTKYIINEDGTAKIVYDLDAFHFVMACTYTTNDNKINFDITKAYNGDKEVDISFVKIFLGSASSNQTTYKYSIKNSKLKLVNSAASSSITLKLKETNKDVPGKWILYASKDSNEIPQINSLWSYKLTDDGYVKMTRSYKKEVTVDEETTEKDAEDIYEGNWDFGDNKITVKITKATEDEKLLSGDELNTIKEDYSFSNQTLKVKDNVFYIIDDNDLITNIFLSADTTDFVTPTINALTGKWRASKNNINYNIEFFNNGSVTYASGLSTYRGTWDFNGEKISVELNEKYNPNAESWGSCTLLNYEYIGKINENLLTLTTSDSSYFMVRQ